MIYSLVICTVIYILLSLVLTGMVNYKALNVGDPLAEVFSLRHIGWMGFFISICAVAAMTSVILVFQLGQPRIWMTMSRDGLLPKKFQTIHPKHKTPSFATIITGLVVGVPILFTERNFVLDFTSIGTLFAFVLVCGGVLLLPRKEKIAGKFHLKHIDAHIIYPVIVLGAYALAYFFFPGYFSDLVDYLLDSPSYFGRVCRFEKMVTYSTIGTFNVPVFANWNERAQLVLVRCMVRNRTSDLLLIRLQAQSFGQ
jgi:amino acid transporter